jgi:hypothetical protein
MIRSLFEWVDTFESSIMIRESAYGFAGLLSIHVVSMAVFAGLILMMDLRLLGWGNNRIPVSRMQGRLFPWQMSAISINAITGFVLIYSQPMRYYGKIFFWTKILLMILAGVNALTFHLTTYKSVAEWDTDKVLPTAARRAGAIGLVLWAGVIIFGRLTAYNWIDNWMAMR